MRTLIALLMAVGMAATSYAAPASYPVTIDSRAQTIPKLTVYRASETAFALTFKDGATASDLTGATVWMAWATNSTATTVSTASVVVVTATNGTATATFSTSALNYTPGRYVYEAGVTVSGNIRVYRQGVFEIVGSPYASGASAVPWTTNFPWSQISGTPTTLAGYGITNSYTNGSCTLVAGTDISITGGTNISNGAQITIAYNGGSGISASTATGIASTVVGAWATTGTVAVATAVSAAQSNAFATAAQGVAATNAQARVAVLETNAVTLEMTNGWVVSSHAAFLTSESDPIFATNGVKLADTNGWVVSSHGSFLTSAQVSTITTYTTTNPTIAFGEGTNVFWWVPNESNALTYTLSGPGAGNGMSGKINFGNTNGVPLTHPTNVWWYVNGASTTNPPTLGTWNELVVDWTGTSPSIGVITTNSPLRP